MATKKTTQPATKTKTAATPKPNPKNTRQGEAFTTVFGLVIDPATNELTKP